MGALHQRAVRQVALNGEAGRTYSFSALSSNSSGSRPFMPRDAGSTSVPTGRLDPDRGLTACRQQAQGRILSFCFDETGADAASGL